MVFFIFTNSYSYTAKENCIQIKGLLESTSSKKDNTRALTLSFGIPVSVSEEWNWGSCYKISVNNIIYLIPLIFFDNISFFL